MCAQAGSGCAMLQHHDAAAHQVLHATFYNNPSDSGIIPTSRDPLAGLKWMKDYVTAGQPAHVRARRILANALHRKEVMQEGFRNTCEVAGRFAQRLGMPEVMQSAPLSDT
jgi:hypothetical protein